ncbi:alpha-L-rhamnosidase [Cnuella takakiae]|uniref:Alpha-L-rhamnosidase n=2 Tax=Cnuella takakiae TaxID=1302690 RepID=A0A1M4VJK0_9BACT|nr:alpha-L-rhamnosidase [Cnuella takakiae]
MNGHISREGITADLEAMKAAGISGVFQFDAGTGIPKGPVAYGSEEFWTLKKHALREALRLGMEVTLHNCPGWSASGGPWIEPKDSMQELTWSEVVVKGGGLLDIMLPKPYHKLGYYQEVALLAFPAFSREVALNNYKASTASGKLNFAQVNGNGEVLLSTPNANEHWLLFAFAEPVKATNITFQVAAVGSGNVRELFDGERNFILLEASQDGVHFQTVATISTGLEAALLLGYKFITFDFTATEAAFFRLTSRLPRRLAQVRFSALERLPNFMEKAGFRFGYHQIAPAADTFQSKDFIALDKVTDLTDYMDSEGRLRWQAPAGHYTLLRLGHTATGAINKAAPDGGQGLECDKMRKAALELHLQKALQPILPELQELAKKGKAGLEIDSFEAGMQNWTAEMPQLFARFQGYRLLPFLPAITGRVVASVALTENFLWDFRQTIAHAVSENYYGAFADWCRQQGLTAYVEPYDKGPFSELSIGAQADVPMGEHWNGLFAILQGNLPIRRTPKLAASIAHTQGKRLVGAETFTSEPNAGKWQEYPFGLKATGDALLAQGVNKMVLHRFVHQPHPTALPGMTMGPWGSHIDRTNTWWPYAREWFTYLARCQWLLRKGQFVADFAYLAPEDSATFTPVRPSELVAAPPEGFAYDVLDAALLQQARVDAGSLVLQSGMRYRVLVIQDYSVMSYPTLAVLVKLVRQGMILVSPPVQSCLGLRSAKALQQFAAWIKVLWGDGKTVGQRSVGKGAVFPAYDLSKVVRQLRLAPDCTFTSQSGDAPITFLHRRTPTEDIYFLCNARRTTEELVVQFRVRGRYPQIIHPVRGIARPASIFHLLPDSVSMPLQLDPYGSLFVVFAAVPLPDFTVLHKAGKTFVQSHPFVPRTWEAFPGCPNNFTLQFWVKPEQDIMLRFSQHMERVTAPYTDYYAIYPAAGNKLYGPGHATCGLAVGRNGVTVWENANGTPEMVLALAAPISGFTHLALVYQKGLPEVYLNGKVLGKGQFSKWQVHPTKGRGVGVETDTYYNGDISDISILPTAIDQAAVEVLSKQQMATQPAMPQVLLHEGSKGSILLAQSGNYQASRVDDKNLFISVPPLPANKAIDGAWHVQFGQKPGAPAPIDLRSLQSLHSHTEARHFSGTAIYTTRFNMQDLPADRAVQWLLDLGRVEVLAEVVLNGKNLGVLWTRPYRVNATQALQEGENVLEIKVTNLWPNRLIGDAPLIQPGTYFPKAADGSFEFLVGGGIKQLPGWYLQGKEQPKDGPVSFTTWNFYTADDPLLESGLIGPVWLQPYYELNFVKGK